LNLTVDIAPQNKRKLRLKNPLVAASGTVGYGTEYAEMVDIERFGAIVSKGTTLEPRDGNPQPRLCETASGLLNSVGLQNIGIDALIEKEAPVWAKWQVPVLVNIAGDSVEEYAELARRLDGVDGVSGIEVNISCPNVARGGMEFGTDAGDAGRVTQAVKQNTSLPVIVKLTPNVTDIAGIARAAEGAGADAISLINTLRGMAIDVGSKRPFLGGATGGLSGPAIKPVALYMVYTVARSVSVPIIGGGGIISAHDALEFIMAGASAFWVSTGVLVDPCSPLDILDGVVDYMKREGIEDIASLVGVAQAA